ncbi:MAG: ATP-binding cassette domain-containing protein [Alphaproteobacteria bacterium]|nr:ATP-binding cassette domain-containing protein [Alphaproteobacteria bacterium]
MSSAVKTAEQASAVDTLLDMLDQTGYGKFFSRESDHTGWGKTLCAMILTLEPGCRMTKIIDALPYCSPQQEKTLDSFDIKNVISRLGYFSRTVRTTLAQLDKRLTPCIFVREDDPNNPYLVLKSEQGQLKVYSPRNNGFIWLEQEECAEMNGEAILFKPYDESRQATSKFMRSGTGYGWFRALLTRFRTSYKHILATGLVLNLLALATPIFMMLVYDRVIASNALDVLPMLCVGAALVIGFEALFRGARTKAVAWFAGRVDNIVGNKIFAHLIDLSPTLIERASIAAQIARIKTFETVRDFFTGAAFLSILELPFIAISLLAMGLIAGPLVLVPLVTIAGFGCLFLLIREMIKKTIRLAAKASSARQQFTIDTFDKLFGIKACGLMAPWYNKFRDLSGRELLCQFNLAWQGMIGEALANALLLCCAVATIGFGAHMIWAGALSPGGLVATMILVWRILTPFYSLCTMIPRIEQLGNSILQVNKLMDLDTEPMEARVASRLSKVTGTVSFQNVTFRYSPELDPVLTNLSLEARLGEFVVISGENGAGKSTLLKLSTGLYRPTDGTVRIDGFDIRQVDAQDLRRKIAYMPQATDFFGGTISENLRIANPLATTRDIAHALAQADLEEEIARLPQGMDTVINDWASLPSSFLTRMALARLYLQPSNLVLIDEIPNSLMACTVGHNFRDYIIRNRGRKTIIMATYRHDFMDMADAVVMMRKGRQADIASPFVLFNREKGKEVA